MRIRNPNPLFLALSLSAFIHGGVLWLVSGGSRPALPERNRSVIVTLLPDAFPPEKAPAAVSPETPQTEIPPPVTESAVLTESAALMESAALTELTEEAVSPVEESAVVSAEIPQVETSEAEAQGFSSPVSTSFVRPTQSVRPDIRENAIARYAAMIHGLIDTRKTYPYQARRQDQQGTVQVRFTLSRRGTLAGDPVTEKSSRYRLLNESALEAVKNAAPYPPFPEEIPEDEMSFQVVVSFSLGIP
jgi:protein TonB